MNQPYVYFVEDDDVDWSIMEGCLLHLGYPKYRRFSTGDEFIEAVHGGDIPVGVVLLDVNLPLMDGYEVLRQLRCQDHPWVVIMLTSNSAAKSIFQSYKDGANAYIIKPFHTHEMKTVLAQIMEFWTRTVTLPAAVDMAG